MTNVITDERLTQLATLEAELQSSLEFEEKAGD